MEDNEALLFKNVKRFSQYSGYTKTLKFEGEFKGDQTRRDIVAIDALHFADYKSENTILINEQYKPKYILRELNKAMLAFQLESWNISSGKWGCGVFNGNLALKFLL